MILVPLDGSIFGEHALPYAMLLARRLGTTLDLAHVHVAPSPVYLEGVPQIDASVELDVIEHDRAYLERVRERIEALGVKASTTLLDGATVGELERHAAATSPELVVMTTHGRGALSRAWLGSVADALARHLTCPVLLVRPPEGAADTEAPALDREPPLRSVLVPMDGSEESATILPHALRLVGDDGAAEVVHVVRPSAVIGGHVFHLTDEQRNRLVQEGNEALRQTLERAGTRADVDVVVASDPARAIVDAADADGVDLIAMATHGRGGLSRLIFGSTTDKVVRAATVPVLVARPPA